MASGIDDEVTLRANREGFLKFQLRPRRLVDVSKVDMSVDILGVKYSSPIVLAPVGGQRSFHDDGELAGARAAKAGDHLQIMSTMTSYGVEDVRAARGDKPIWLQLYATNKWEVARGDRQALRERRLPRRRRDGRSQRRTQSGNPVPPAADRHARLQRLPRPLELPGQPQGPGDVPGPRSDRAPQHPVVRHDLGLLQAAARHHQDEDPGQGHPRL